MIEPVHHCRCGFSATARQTKDPSKTMEFIVHRRAASCYHKLGDVVIHEVEGQAPELPEEALEA